MSELGLRDISCDIVNLKIADHNTKITQVILSSNALAFFYV